MFAAAALGAILEFRAIIPTLAAPTRIFFKATFIFQGPGKCKTACLWNDGRFAPQFKDGGGTLKKALIERGNKKSKNGE